MRIFRQEILATKSLWLINLIDTARRKHISEYKHHHRIFQSVMPSFSLSSTSFLFSLFLLLAVVSPQINAFEDDSAALKEDVDTNNRQSPFCVIGRLRMCNDDEDCLEMPANRVTDHDSNSWILRRGICICRDPAYCKRKRQSQPLSDQLLSSDDNHPQEPHSHLGLFFGILSCLSIIGVVGFFVYYHGIRYGMIRHFARRLGLTRNSAQIEDQLLDRIPDASINRGTDGDNIELNI